MKPLSALRHLSRCGPSYTSFLILLLSLLLVECGGGTDSGGSGSEPLWVSLYYPDPQTQPFVTGHSTFPQLYGRASCGGSCPSSESNYMCQNSVPSAGPTNVGVAWKNLTTGAGGETLNGITGQCGCIFSACFNTYFHYWEVNDLPLATGNNIIQIKAYDTLGFSATTSVTIIKANGIQSTTPSAYATGVPINTTIYVTFSADINASTVTSSSFVVKNSGGTVNGKYTVNSSTATFTPSANLTANTIYTVNTTSAIKGTNGTQMAFDVWSFTTGTSISDITPPIVSSTNPANGDTEVSATNPIYATFSEPMMTSSINANTFTLNNGVTGSVTLSSNYATFTPSAPLAFLKTYTASITTGVKDQAGNAMTTPYSWSFTTSAAPLPPIVISARPANNAIGVSVNTPIYATFSESMDPTTINTNTFSLNNGVTGTVTYNGKTNTAIFTPSTSLAFSTAYVATITSGVKETFGSQMAASYSWSFTTAPELSTNIKMPDTGQVTCYGANGAVISCTGTGQDGDYAINAQSYTDNANGTITDNVTGLVWQQLANNGYFDWTSANTYCSNLTLGGVSGWRLPSLIELIGLLNYGNSNSYIDSSYFLAGGGYWSTTSDAYNNSAAWALWFVPSTNNGVAYSKTGDFMGVKCVRGGEGAPALVDNSNGTVTDNSTLLTWQQNESPTMSWQDALTYCEGLSLAGQTDWRLPNIKELASLVDYAKYNPAINKLLFANATPTAYWSSTTDPYYKKKWFVDFIYGQMQDWADASSLYKARCVRGG